MKSLYNDDEARKFDNDDLAMRVYTSRLLGASEDLVMHGGGNTSVKSNCKNFFGDDIEVLYVKGSGWDLKTIEKAGFTPLTLAPTQRLATVDTLSDDDMVKQLKLVTTDPVAPAPSVEAILHAIIPFKFVDHTHTDSVVTLSNTPDGKKAITTLYPDCLVLDYIMPGFILSKQVFEAINDINLTQYKGIILLHHGVFTFDDNAKVAYENMIDLVSRAEEHISKNATLDFPSQESEVDLIKLASLRQTVSKTRGIPQLAMLNTHKNNVGFSSRADFSHIATRGPITPDHVIRTKRTAMVINNDDISGSVASFANDYQAYFEQNSNGGLTMLDTAPRWGGWPNCGTVAFGSSVKECDIISDITRHTIKAIQTAESLGGWSALSAKDIFDLEYWVLEQNKLKKSGCTRHIHQGKIAVVSGCATGIGKATAEMLHKNGAVVVGLDINPKVAENFNTATLKGVVCDLTNFDQVKDEIDNVVRTYGGIDILVCNAGIFKAGQTIEDLDDNTWDATMLINLTATERLIKYATPYLKLGIDSSIVVVGSRNYAAPGAGASAYSVSKAGITQLARVAAMELAPYNVRVNIVHPDAVFDTDLWTDEALASSAKRYNLTIAQYKTRNLLKTEITSKNVAQVISTVSSKTFKATTGAQFPVDGGNDRVI